jgi:hypothetical protein
MKKFSINSVVSNQPWEFSRVRISVGVGFAGTSSHSRALGKELLK